MSSLRSF